MNEPQIPTTRTDTMNYTKSNIIAVGAPMSLARALEEAKLGIDFPTSLLLTEEGTHLAARFSLTVGKLWKDMDEDGKRETLRDPRLFQFLNGFIYSRDWVSIENILKTNQ